MRFTFATASSVHIKLDNGTVHHLPFLSLCSFLSSYIFWSALALVSRILSCSKSSALPAVTVSITAIGFFQASGNFPQAPVSSQMAVRIVDILKIVQIQRSQTGPSSTSTEIISRMEIPPIRINVARNPFACLGQGFA